MYIMVDKERNCISWTVKPYMIHVRVLHLSQALTILVCVPVMTSCCAFRMTWPLSQLNRAMKLILSQAISTKVCSQWERSTTSTMKKQPSQALGKAMTQLPSYSKMMEDNKKENLEYLQQMSNMGHESLTSSYRAKISKLFTNHPTEQIYQRTTRLQPHKLISMISWKIIRSRILLGHLVEFTFLN